jgi:beta-lactamase regulating signal transducer with metallopeptidase domain
LDLLLQVALSNAVLAVVLALAAAAVGSLCRRPALTHCLWILVLLKLLTPPLIWVRVPWPGVGESSLARSDMKAPALAPRPEPEAGQSPPGPAREKDGEALPWEEDGPNPERALPAQDEPLAQGPAPEEPAAGPLPAVEAPASPAWESFWLALIIGVWLTGSAVWFTLAAYRVGRFQRLLGYGRPALPGLQRQAEILAGRMGLARCPRLWVVPGPVSPLLWTIAGPGRLVVPAELLGRLDAEQQTTLLAHELAHLRRGDPWVRVLEFLAMGLYWWHPLVWWARREVREAEEQCCDAWVVRVLPGAARAYAKALLETVDFLSEARPALPPVASGVGPVHILRRRLTMILRGTTPQSMTRAGLLAVLTLGMVLLPLMPTLGQEQPPDRGSGVRPERRGAEAPRREEGRRDDDLDRARVEVKKMTEAIQAMRENLEKQAQELRQAEERLRAAHQRLADAENRRARDREPVREGRPREEPRGRVGRFQGGSGIRRETAETDQDRRIQNLERRLEALTRELEALRRELRGRRPEGPGASPAREERGGPGPRPREERPRGPGGAPRGGGEGAGDERGPGGPPGGVPRGGDRPGRGGPPGGDGPPRDAGPRPSRPATP